MNNCGICGCMLTSDFPGIKGVCTFCQHDPKHGRYWKTNKSPTQEDGMNFKPLDHIPTGRTSEGDKYIDDQYRYHEFRNGEWVTLNLIDLVATVERLDQAVKVLGELALAPYEQRITTYSAFRLNCAGPDETSMSFNQLRDLFGLE